jgi:hypothetical protein
MNTQKAVRVRMHFGKFGWESDWKWGRKVRALIHFLIKGLWWWEWSLKGRWKVENCPIRQFQIFWCHRLPPAELGFFNYFAIITYNYQQH